MDQPVVVTIDIPTVKPEKKSGKHRKGKTGEEFSNHKRYELQIRNHISNEWTKVGEYCTLSSVAEYLKVPKTICEKVRNDKHFMCAQLVKILDIKN